MNIQVPNWPHSLVQPPRLGVPGPLPFHRIVKLYCVTQNKRNMIFAPVELEEKEMEESKRIRWRGVEEEGREQGDWLGSTKG